MTGGVDSTRSESNPSRTSEAAGAPRILSVILFVVLVALIGLVIWASNRGLDLTDEGHYLQLYAHPESAPASVVHSQFYLLVSLVTGPADLGIAGYRLVALVLLVLSAGFFGFSFHRFASKRVPEIAFPPVLATMSFVTVSGLLGYSWAPLAVSYSTLAAAIINVIAGLVLLALAGSSGKVLARSWVLQMSIAGALLPILFYVKWTSALLLAGTSVVLVVLMRQRDGRRMLGVAAAGSAASFSLLTQELLVGPFSLRSLVASARNISSMTHSPADLVENYLLLSTVDTLRVLWEDPLRIVALVLLLAGGPLALLVRGRVSWVRVWMLPVAGGGYLLAEIPNASYLDRLTNFKLVAALVVAGALSVFVAQTTATGHLPDLSVRKLTRTGRLMWLLALLGLGMALTTGAGSNSHILTTTLHGGAGIGAATVVALSSLRAIGGQERDFGFLIAMPVLSVLLAAQIVNGVCADPYRLIAARVDQQESIPGIPRFEGIKFDSRSAEFLSAVNDLVQEQTSFAPGDIVLAYASTYGLVYMIDGVSPGVPWISPTETGRQGRACGTLRTVGEEIAETTLILENSPPSDDLALCLREVLPGYPDRFVEVGRVAIPDGYGSGMSSGEYLRVLELRG